MTDHEHVREYISDGEHPEGSCEFKERLNPETHLVDEKRESLAAQMRHRVLSGDGIATYIVGVTDDGGVHGIERSAVTETVEVLDEIAGDIGATIPRVSTYEVEGGVIAVVTVESDTDPVASTNHIVVGTAGHVDHGKSTLVGSLVTGEADDGEGGLREYLDVQPHEAERGLSADLSYAVYGFDDEGNDIRMDNPARDSDRARVVEESERLVSFVDTVGHEPWLRTTIRGLLGQRIDYGLLTVAADDGPMQTTREHLGVMLAMGIPTIVAITKSDLVDADRIEEVKSEVANLLREVGKTPLDADRLGAEDIVRDVDEDIVPIVTTSTVEFAGITELDALFAELPERQTDDGPFTMYVDRCYTIQGVGAVASGAISRGTVEPGDELLLGPFPDGSFTEVEVRSIEMHYQRMEEAGPGSVVGIALKGVNADDIERGMALLDPELDPEPTREFSAEIQVLNHPTRIQGGYEPVVHLETIGETATIQPDPRQLLPGDTDTATVRFKFRPYYIEPGQQFIFRESQSKGVGTVQEVERDE